MHSTLLLLLVLLFSDTDWLSRIRLKDFLARDQFQVLIVSKTIPGIRLIQERGFGNYVGSFKDDGWRGQVCSCHIGQRAPDLIIFLCSSLIVNDLDLHLRVERIDASCQLIGLNLSWCEQLFLASAIQSDRLTRITIKILLGVDEIRIGTELLLVVFLLDFILIVKRVECIWLDCLELGAAFLYSAVVALSLLFSNSDSFIC